MPQINENVFKDFAIERGVSDLELKVMRLALEGQRVGKIAVELGIGESTVWTRLRNVYSKFGIEGTGSGKLAVLKRRLEAQYQAYLEKITNPRQDKNPTPKLEYFYGRTDVKNELEKWLLEDRCQLVALLGIGGIGKTALSIELTKQIQMKGDFKSIIWESLRNAPLVEDLLERLLLQLPNQQKPDLSGGVDEKISRLIQYLQEHRCLIVLDNAESILENGKLAGVYREKYQNYGKLLRAVGESFHQSCLVITSREKPQEVALLEEKTPLVKSRELEGLDETAAKELIKKVWSDASGDEENSLALGDEEEWKKLNKLLRGNPLVIKIISPTIQERYGRNICKFVEKEEESVFLPGGLRELLSEQLGRLSELEKEIMYWLATNRTPVSVSELQEDIISTVPQSKLLKALESLSWRSLIEKNGRKASELTLQPVIMEYITEQLVQEFCREIRDYKNNKIQVLNRCTLLKARAEDYIKREQRAHILKPIKEELLISLGDEKAVEKKLKDILSALPKQSPPKPGYAGGNIINLLSELKDKLIDKEDFSDLAVWQADLEAVTLHEINFAYADLKNSTFAENLSSILSVAFNSKGKLLATGEVNGKVRLWNVADGKTLWICGDNEKHDSWVQSVAFSRDGEMLASSSGDQKVKLWKVNNVDPEKSEYWKPLEEENTGPVRSVAFSPDGKILASGSDDGFVRLWNVDTGQRVNKLSEKHKHKGWVWSVAFSPDGTILASGSDDRTVKLWDGRKGFYSETLEGHDKCVSSVAFSPNKDRITLASSSEDKTIRLWHEPTKQPFATSKEHASWVNSKTLKGHTSWVWSVTFSQDEKTLASSSDDRTIKLWKVDTGECLVTFGEKTNGIEEEHNNRIGTVAFSPDKITLASGSEDQTVKFWDIETKKCFKTLTGKTYRVGAVAFSPDGKTLASSSDDKTVKLWNVGPEDLNRKNIKTLKEHLNRVGSVAFSPDGKILASGSDDHTVNLWKKEKDTWRCFRTLKGHENRVSSIAFSPDGEILASGSDDHTVKLWEVKTGKCTETLKHNSRLRSVAFVPKLNANSPDEKTLASVSDNEKVRLWRVVDTEKGTEISEMGDEKYPRLKENGNWVWSVAFSPDGKTLASGNYNHTVWLWDMDAEEWLPLQEKHKGPVRSVAFSPDGKTFASGSDDKTVKLWEWKVNTKTWCSKNLGEHDSRVTSVAFSLDGKTLASGSDDETIRLWEVETGKFLFLLKSEKLYQETDFTGVTNLDAQKATLKELGAIV